MHTRARIRVMIVGLCLGVALCSGCGRMGDDRAFAKAKEANTEEAYRSYLGSFRRGRHARAAREAAADLAWQRLSQGRATRESLTEFVEQYGRTTRAPEARKRLADLDWAAAEQSNEMSAYRQFADQYPDDPRAAKALQRAGDLAWRAAEAQGSEEAYTSFHSQYPNHAQAAAAQAKAEDCAWTAATQQDTVAAYQAFLDKYPSSPRTEQARVHIEGREVDLYDAQREGLVRATVTGSGISSVSVKLRRSGNDRLRVVIPTGTFFVSGGAAQNMVSRASVTVELLDNDTAEVSLDTSCADLHLSVPSEDERFSVRPSAPDSQLRRLMEVIEKESPSEVVAQVAVWAVTDNPSRSELLSTYRSYGSYGLPGLGEGSPAADDEDIKAAAELLRKAGIEPKSKRLFR